MKSCLWVVMTLILSSCSDVNTSDVQSDVPGEAKLPALSEFARAATQCRAAFIAGGLIDHNNRSQRFADELKLSVSYVQQTVRRRAMLPCRRTTTRVVRQEETTILACDMGMYRDTQGLAADGSFFAYNSRTQDNFLYLYWDRKAFAVPLDGSAYYADPTDYLISLPGYENKFSFAHHTKDSGTPAPGVKEVYADELHAFTSAKPIEATLLQDEDHLQTPQWSVATAGAYFYIRKLFDMANFFLGKMRFEMNAQEASIDQMAAEMARVVDPIIAACAADELGWRVRGRFDVRESLQGGVKAQLDRVRQERGTP